MQGKEWRTNVYKYAFKLRMIKNYEVIEIVDQNNVNLCILSWSQVLKKWLYTALISIEYSTYGV